MHEMSLATSILDIAQEELSKRGLSRLIRIEVHCGALSNVVGDSLQFCFEALTKGTPQENAVLDIVEVPLRLRCNQCGHVFTGEGQESIWLPCPACGSEFGHSVLQGKEFFIQQLEAE